MASLMLSRHGIWYYRKVNVLPSGKRREIRRSLRTRSKSEAKKRIAKYQENLTPLMMDTSKQVLTLLESLQTLQEMGLEAKVAHRKAPSRKTPNIEQELDQYLKIKQSQVRGQELGAIESNIRGYLTFTKDPFSKRQAALFIDQLTSAIPTRNKYVSKIGGFFLWMNRRSEIEIKNPFQGLSIKDNVPVSEKRDAYTIDQVAKLRDVCTAEAAWKRWVILIGSYSGLRANEICQLYLDDIQQIDGLWCFRIDNTHTSQQLKTPSSRRFVPIHDSLINAGFWNYFESKKGQELLFPETRNKKRHSQYFISWFSQFRKALDVPEFHSLRHYAATTFKNAGIPEQYAGALLGHLSNTGITYSRYGKQVSDLAKLKEIINLL
ncbi:site-specific integrase [Serratia fonticola]|uniref:site-specific integrase n=1 Tax=Serratia fonticola TaxID=47917 RepID=UPI00211C7D6F|nr:site-specific integrase [Serratia fonticola]